MGNVKPHVDIYMDVYVIIYTLYHNIYIYIYVSYIVLLHIIDRSFHYFHDRANWTTRLILVFN